MRRKEMRETGTPWSRWPVLLAPLTAAVAATAVMAAPGAAARTTAAAWDASLSCSVIDDLGNNHYGGWDNFQEIYFGYGRSHAIPFCNINRGNGRFWIEEEVNGQLSGQCLVSDDSGTLEVPCSDAPSTDWTAINVGTYHSQSIWVFRDPFDGLCLYDDRQDPAIEAKCITSDGFEHFIWDALP